MYPIGAKDKDGCHKGLGTIEFFADFYSLCRDHTKSGNKKKFAFIVCRKEDRAIMEMFQNPSTLLKFERLTGKDLLVFHLYTGNQETHRLYNRFIRRTLNLERNRDSSSVVFFEFDNNEVTNIEQLFLTDNTLEFEEELINIFEANNKKTSYPLKNTIKRIRQKKVSIRIVIDLLLTIL
tara:strand:+ start:620 stop:1156 length:537 start_codon:yes stop_codon:yes gene_type:complete